MKTLQFLSAALLLLASVGIADAQNHLYIAGSTANRAPADAAIIAQFDVSPAVTIATDANVGGEHSSIFYGNIGGVSWIIKTAWTGSENGVQLTSTNTLYGGFLLDSIVTGNTVGSVTVNSSYNVTGNTTTGTGTSETHVADAGFADTFANASQFQGTYNGVTYTAPTEVVGSPVAINPFKYFANHGAPAGLTGITSQLLRKIFAAGKLPLSFFTGAASDANSTVYAVGRNPDSGSRVTAMIEPGIGGATQAVTEFAPSTSAPSTINAAGTAVYQLVKYPSGTVDGVTFATGNNGYASGGNLAAALNCDYTNGGAGITAATSTHTYNTSADITAGTNLLAVISYASTNDGDGQLPTAINPNGNGGTSPGSGGIVELSYNGVKLGFQTNYNNAAPLTSGAYTFWSYEHLLINTFGQAASAGAYQTLVQNIASSLPTAAMPVGTGYGIYPVAVQIGSMKAARTADGAVVGIATGVTVY